VGHKTTYYESESLSYFDLDSCSMFAVRSNSKEVSFSDHNRSTVFNVELLSLINKIIGKGRGCDVVGWYRYGYQSSEKDDEVKGSGNSYTTRFRQLDPRLGIWFSIDPKNKELPWQSPYCSMDNNPIWFNDQFGDKVGFEKDKNVSKSEFKRMKNEIKTLRKNSKSFETMYQDLDSRNEVFVFRAVKSEENKASIPGEPLVIQIGVDYKINTDENNREKSKFARVSAISHELTHKIMELYDIKLYDTGVLKQQRFSPENNQKIVDEHKFSETSAMHGENIVRSELRQNLRFRKIEIQRYYRPAFKLDKDGTIIFDKSYDVFNILGIDKTYYDEKRDIYKEIGIIR
jgi:hypothetical protein